MFYLRIYISSLLFAFICATAHGQPFACDGRLIVSTSQSNTTTYRIDTGLGVVYYSPIHTYVGTGFDALGFNPKDNYIYAIEENTNSVVRLSSNGTYEILGSVSSSDISNSYAGDCSANGYFLCHENELDQILIFDVLNDFELVDQIDLFWDPNSQNNGPFTTRIDDFAIDPNNPSIAYTFQGNYSQDEFAPTATRGYLLKVNIDPNHPNAGMVTPIAPIPVAVISQLEGLFFTQDGRLHGFGPANTGASIINRFISINTFTAATSIEGVAGPVGANSDGCSCPYSLAFENDAVPRGITCSDSELTFAISIRNYSNEELSDLFFTDTIPEGMIIENITGDFNGTIVPGTGAGTGVLTINNLQVSTNEIATININVRVLDIPLDLVANQAHLTNLPALFGGFMRSDDPQTNTFIGDVTQFYSSAQPIDNVELEIIPPSNCLTPNDAQVYISSPVLLTNQNYQVQLIDQNWDEFNFTVLVDDENSFVLDSLSPGEYQLKQLTPENSKCSFTWKDTTFIINPPNEQLQASAESNAPICEGVSLLLNGTISPAGSVSWIGPNGFVSEDLNPLIDSATILQSGTFEMIATYGVCEQIRTVDVYVAPDIQASIIGKTEYCERERMQLTAEGNGDVQRFRWSGPDNLSNNRQQMNVSSIVPADEGLYQVIIDNSFCLDTASVAISVLPSPTIHLPDLIETDFCEPVKLSTEITGDNQVEYTWTPNEGLSCYDCPNPELLVPFLPRYQLTVINESLCTDTASVKISLSKEKLIYVPNAFSPDFNGFNDYFQLFPGCGVSKIKNLEIFNRWGAVVYHKKEIDHNDPQEFWNGLVKGKIGNSGVYIWQVEIELVDGTSQKFFGDISLLK